MLLTCHYWQGIIKTKTLTGATRPGNFKYGGLDMSRLPEFYIFCGLWFTLTGYLRVCTRGNPFRPGRLSAHLRPHNSCGYAWELGRVVRYVNPLWQVVEDMLIYQEARHWEGQWEGRICKMQSIPRPIHKRLAYTRPEDGTSYVFRDGRIIRQSLIPPWLLFYIAQEERLCRT